MPDTEHGNYEPAREDLVDDAVVGDAIAVQAGVPAPEAFTGVRVLGQRVPNGLQDPSEDGPIEPLEFA